MRQSAASVAIEDQPSARYESASGPEISVSIVIVTFQSESHVDACLSSIHRFATSGAHVIVVDNASTDATCSIVRNRTDPPTLVALPKNRGFAAGVNLGAAHCDGPYLLLLNPDAELTSGALSALVDYMEAHPFVAAAGPQLVSPMGTLQDSAFTYPSLLMAWLEFFPWPTRALRSRWNGRLVPGDDGPILIDHPLGAAMLVRRSAWLDVGPLDERFFLYCEEVDWCMRAKRRGWLIASLPSARVVHHGGASAASARGDSIVHLYQSRRLLHRKHRGVLVRAAHALITRVGLAQERRRLRRRPGQDAAARAAGIARLLAPPSERKPG